MIILGLLFILLSIVCYSVLQILQLKHFKSIWGKTDIYSFFGTQSWVRKYKRTFGPKTGSAMLNPIKEPNWYYKFFKLDFEEQFIGSATVFVFLTDAMHLFQFLFFNFLTLGIVLCLGFTNLDILINFVAIRLLIWLIWGLFFEYLLLRR
jgi:hypothetical protein